VRVFDDTAVAEIMLPYTDGKPRERRAMLAISMQGGGGYEIWQHTGKTSQMPSFEVALGDLGICVGKMKCLDAAKAYNNFKAKGLSLLTEVVKTPNGVSHFYVKDLYGYTWEFVQDSSVFDASAGTNGGVFGAVIGVKNVEESLKVYKDILGYNTVVYDKESVFEDFKGVKGGENRYRRVLLSKDGGNKGAFCQLFGPSQIELLQVLDREPKDIFEGRMWGDPGFIHLCYDIIDMDDLRKQSAAAGFPFTVDSSKATDNFDMGEAAGNFAYIQAPEGTLIEFVETMKVPVLKKLGIVIDLKKRDQSKPLPRWLLRLFRFKREKVN